MISLIQTNIHTLNLSKLCHPWNCGPYLWGKSILLLNCLLRSTFMNSLTLNIWLASKTMSIHQQVINLPPWCNNRCLSVENFVKCFHKPLKDEQPCMDYSHSRRTCWLVYYTKDTFTCLQWADLYHRVGKVSISSNASMSEELLNDNNIIIEFSMKYAFCLYSICISVVILHTVVYCWSFP